MEVAEKSPGIHAIWLRYGLSVGFLALTLIRILDNGLFALGWVSDLLMAGTFLVIPPPTEGESWRHCFGRPRTVFGLCLLLAGLGFTIRFDLRHFLGK